MSLHDEIAQLPPLAAGELRPRAARNDTEAAYPEGECLHTLFARQAARTPDAEAVRLDGQRLTYAELDAGSNRLAHHLRGLGVGPSVLVGLCVERSIEMVVALLGILKAGGAYVPLDPSYPPARLSVMIADARLGVLVTQGRVASQLASHEASLVLLDDDAAEWRRQPATPVESGVTPDDLAYVIYTSGSSGKPKGAMLDHRGPVNTIADINDRFGVGPGDRVLALSAFNFDLSVYDVFGSLAAGATIVLPEAENARDPAYWADVVARQGITLWNTVPALMDMLVDHAAREGGADLGSLRLALLSGDWIPVSLPDRLRALVPGIRVISLGGATEASIWSILYPIERVDPSWRSIPYGRPMKNQRFHVLDDGLEPCPVGVEGMLYIGGIGVAKGYFGDEEKTRQAFIEHPRTGERLYRTGDLGRYMADGNIEFLGRKDFQVKIRGFRIELGDIEAALASHPAVKACVVIAREDTPGDKRLVAYVVCGEGDVTVNELRERIGARLPEYMVPSAFVFLDALPLSSNGKVDRKALPSPEATRGAAETFYVAPRTATERALTAIWEELLQVQPIGVRDNFFLLGGHSLVAVRLVAAAKARLGAALTVATLFHHPTIEALSALCDAGAERPAALPQISLSPRAEGEAPHDGLSGSERRIWFLEKLSPETRSYQVPHVFQVASALCVPALHESVRALALRHEILRTAYPEVDGTPARRVSDEVSIPIRVEDVSSLPEAERDAALQAILAAEVKVRFDLSRGPLTRVVAVKTAEDRHVVVVHQHHIITDEWSWGMLLAELSSLYEAVRRGEAADLPPLAYQVSDYARAERAALSGDGLAASRAYWKAALADVPRLDVPIVSPSSGAISGPEGAVSIQIPAETSRRLQALAHDSGATPFMAWYAALVAVLSRYSRQTDFALGAILANRQVAGTEAMLGFLANTVVLRTDLSGDPTFSEILRRARLMLLGVYEHQALPLDVVVQDLGLSRHAGENPLYDVSFFEVTPPATGASAGWSPLLGAVPERVATAKNALAVTVQHRAEGTVVEVLYDTTRVSQEAAERLCGHLETLAADAVAHPDRRLSDLDLLTAEETERLAAWNDTPPADPAARFIHEVIAEHAARTPDALAVEQDGRRLTYGELEAQANRLAHYLRSLGVGPEVRVALCVERSFEMVVGLLGILKAGGAFVPLDPSYPSERLCLFLAEAAVPVLLTQAHLEDWLPAPSVTVVRLDADAARWASLPETPPESGLLPESSCYAIFTSGSTGRPKLVVNEHRGLAARVAFHREHIVIHPSDRVLQSAPVAFDGAIMDWMKSLCNGAALVLPSSALGPVEAIAECLEHRGVTVSFIPPAMLRVLTCRAPELRLIVLAGDATAPALVARWAEGRMVQNSYGPTEFSIFGAQAFFDPERPERFSIGRPVTGVCIHVLDGAKRPVPIGMPGEIHLSGVGLARGYLNRPGLTAERFVPDPFSKESGARMYCTGDLARWNEDGELEFLGRADHQVKIRGFRVEVGEVEAALSAHSAVTACAVVAREDAPGNKRLIAYVVAQGGAPEAGALREHLRATLPDYMIPSAFVSLDALPLSPNGKVDRKRLPAPESTREAAETAYIAPRTEAERALAEVWSEVLRTSPVGIWDNFFALGGDSILAIQVVGRAKRAGLHLSVRDMFTHQTVADLAQVARSSSTALAEQGAVTGAAPLTPIQRWFLGKDTEELHHFNQAMMWTPSPSLSPEIVAEALGVVARQHDALRLRYRRAEGAWVAEHVEETALPLERVDLAAVAPGARAAAVAAAANALQGGLSVSAGPVTRAAWLDLGEEGARLLLVVHHLMVDGVSWRILHEDLERACEALLAGRTPELGLKTTSFRQWSERLHGHVAGGGISEELGYWQAQCARGVTEIPLDREAPLGTVGESRTLDVELSAEETRALLQDVGAAYRTEINDVLLSAFAAALSALCRTETVCVGLEGHGREAVVEDVDVSRTVGWFTSMFPVWLTVPEGDDAAALLKGVKEQLRSVPRRGVGYGWLRYAHPDEAVRASLSVDSPVVFNYLGQLDMAAQGRGLLGPAAEPTGMAASPRMELWHALSVNGGVWNGRLRFGWTYSPAVHDASTVERLAARFVAALRRLIAHCASGEAFGYTPSDFPLARLGQEALDRLLGAVRDVESVYPLSPLQAGLLFHALREPESPTYTVQLAIELGGEIDAAVLEGAWRAVIARHAVYRTSFVWQGVPEPLQVVRRSAPFSMPVHDWSSLDEAEAEARWGALQREQRAAGFDFARAPLMRILLVRLPGGRTWMLKTEHHILGDGWSMPVVLGDLQAAYTSLRGGGKPALPEPAPYERYIAWLASRDEEAAGAFFAEYLAGIEAPTRLPFPPPAAMPAEAAREHARFDTSLAAADTEALTAFARRHGLTVNTVVQGALAQVVGRYTGRTDVVLGMLTSGRSAPIAGIERMVGLFINTLPLRARWSDTEGVLEWLQRLQSEQVDLRAHEATPLHEVQRWSAVGGGQALFDTLLAFENYPVDDAAQQAEVLPIIGFQSFEQTSYPLAIAAVAGKTLNLRWMWNPAALRGEDVERLWGHLRTLLLDMVAHPDKRLSDLALLTEAERRQLAAWNDTAAPYPEGKCLHDLFDEQAARTPDAMAVRFKGAGVTYRELSARSTRLAHHLRSLGVGPRVLVGLCVERSVEMIVALLAIVKAGGAYVPLEPSYPAARLSVMIDAARIKVLVTQAEIADRLPPHEAAVVRLDQDAAAWQGHPVTRVESGITPEDPAYVIYTSGSSGKPKGAMLDHRGPVNTIAEINDRFGVGPGDRVLALSAFSFDLSVYDVFGILAAGATIILPDPTNAKDPAYWAEVVAAEGITIWNTVPALMDALVDHASSAPGALLGTLRLALLSGDWIPVSLPDRLRALIPGIRVISMGGATEASIWSIIYPIEQVDPSWRSIPYGRPMRNQRFHVLDERLEPCPVGIDGMLYIGGIGVAMGYHGEEELTRRAYIIHPRTGERLYRTGDLGRYMPDGNIEFLGRKDFQVKIRGFRIELGDIEAALASHPAVKACVVVAREDTPGDKRLVAYVVSGEGEATANDLRDRIRARLPEYMMPSAFVFLDALPLSSNGKVDRKALPSPEAVRDAAEASYVAPRTETERALVALWEELLDVRPIGAHDDFFLIGGHSLLAVRLVSAVKARLGLALTVGTLFEHSTVATLAAALDEAAERPAPAAPLSPSPRGAGEPAYAGLSGTERRIWFVDRLSPEARSYQVPQVFVVRGALSEQALRQSVRLLAERQEILRTTYPEVDGVPARVMAEDVSIPVRVEDVSALPEAERDNALRALLTAEIGARFDLGAGPLTRVLAVSMEADRHIVLVLQHHLITDEWSSGVLLSELSRLYEACCRGDAADLPPLAYQFADHARAEQEALTGGGFAGSRAYWKDKLSGVPRLELPILRPAAGSGAGPEGHFLLRVPERVSGALQALAREHGCTPFMAWYAVILAVLSRYSDQKDFGLGAVTANREVPGAADLLGFFTSTVVLRTDLSGDPTFGEILRRARGTALDAYEHQALPFDVVVQDQGLSRQPGENPLYDVGFFEVTSPATGASTAWSPLLDLVPAGVVTAKHALELAVVHGAEGTDVHLSYDTTRLDHAAVERLGGHLRALVQDAVAHPGKRLSELALLTEAERRQLAAWNETAAPYPEGKCIHELFEEQAARTPDAVALVFDEQQLTYRELDQRSNRLAHHLRALGVGPEVLVGLCVERSLEMVVALLAILKAGGAYVPLDPGYPRERLAFMLADARPAVLLTQERLQGRLPAHEAVTVHLDAGAPPWQKQPITRPDGQAGPDNAIYVIYTSGSTGRPKGVLNTHRGLNNRLRWMQRAYALTPSDAVLQKTPLSFDVSGWELWWPLLQGARMVIAAPEGHKDPRYLAALIQERGVTTMHFVPSMFGVFLTATEPRERASLRLVFTSGEALPAHLRASWYAGNQGELHNLYGPTEAAIDVTSHACRPEEEGPVPIGRPIDNTRTYVLDGNLLPMPVGLAGELFLSGVQLARGYLNRPGLTAERFLPDPFSPEAGARMYRTGDIARWREDGALEFLGRVDHQVKIRGFRIELGEIEAALSAHPLVRDCVVMAREDTPGDKRLVAYVACGEGEVTASELRERTQARLPEYMIPSVFVFLDALPLSSNGKVDRKALPSPEATRATAETSYVAPRTELERALVAIWEELLDVRPIGAHDSFFLLGGHSLLAVRLVSAVRARLGLALTLATVFQHPTVAALAALLDEAAERPAPAAALSPSPRGAGEAAYAGLSGAERRIWFIDRLSPEARSYQAPQVFVVRGALSEQALRQSVRLLAERQEILRTTYPEVDGVPARVVAEDVSIPVRVEDVSALPEAERDEALRALLAAEIEARFDLGAGPLTRVLAVSMAADRHVVLVLQHHIITDEWSSGVLLSELSRLYEACCRGEAADLPALPYQLADHARAEQEALAGGGFAGSRAYWKDNLSGVPRLRLPIISPTSGHGPGPEGSVELRVPERVSGALQALAREHGCTPFMAWYAVIAAVLSRYSGQEDFGLGAVIANREVPGTADLLGFFTNTVVLRTDLSGNPTFVEILARARQMLLGAYEHQALPFDVVMQDQGLSRQVVGESLYDVAFLEVTTPTAGAAAGWSPLPDAVPAGMATAKDALAVIVDHRAEGTVVGILYDTTRVSQEAAERLCGHLSTLVTDAVAHPDRRLSDLDLLTEEEAERLAAWNDTPPADPAARFIHEVIAEHAARTPEALAVEQDGRRLTYGELEAQANRLAHYLRSLGVGPEVRVALCVERSFEMVVGLLGILKAGGAFVPLDPAYPPERLSLSVAEAAVPVLLTQAHLEDRLPAPGVTVVRLDADAARWASLPETPPESGLLPGNACYAIFTSGSTGRPKLVVNEHRGLAARVAFHREHIAIHPSDRVLQSAPVAFDGAIMDWMKSLCNGAALVLPSSALGPVEAIAECLEHRGVTVSFIPPAVLRVLTCRASELRLIVLAGDATTPALVARWAEGRKVQNSYGPTEFSIFGAQAFFDPERPERFSIGRPVTGVYIHVLDGAKRPVPIGMPGEIHLSGVGLARGYLNRPGLTAERFVPDPFSKEPGARMYCTGDLARWNEDGELEFLGRADHQVKIRGFRVEVGEVEAALSAHSAVTACAVVAREDAPGDKRLIAYVVAQGGAPEAGALREHLRSRLPDYMIPSAFVFLDAMPLSPNGKVDRKALPSPEATRDAAEASYVAPRTEAERALAEVWSEVLRASPVGVHDNFFALGGDSILAIQVVGRAKRAGLHVTVRDMFMHQTIADLAQAARRESAVVAEQGAVTGTAPLTPIQQWFLGGDPEGVHHFNQAMMWTPSPELPPEIVADALRAVAEQHDALRLRYHRTESGWVQDHAEGAALPLERVDLSTVSPSAREAAAEAAANVLQGGLCLSTGPVVRAAWLDLGEEGARLLLVVHHLVVDGVSWRILHEDLERACEALLAGRTPELGLKTTSFQRWCVRLHELVAGGGLSEELGYWQAQCARGVAPLPLDREAALGTVGESRTVDVELSEEETRALLTDVGAAYRTEINDVLLSALAAALCAFCRTETVCVGLEGHGRESVAEDVDVSRTVGWFTSMFPVWLTVPEGDDPAALLKGVKEQLRSVPNRGVGYGWLRYAHPDEAVRAALSVESPVVFNYLGQLDMASRGQGLLGPAVEPTGLDVSPRMERQHALSVNGGVLQGRLRFGWTYSPAVHDASTVERLAARFVASLRRLIAHCASGEAFGYTPSDFPLARLGQEALDRLLGAVRDVESVYPLSPLQAGLLFHALREPESPTYTVQLALELGGEVDAAALEGAWRAVIARHAVYRTSILWQGVPEPLQVVRRSVPFSMATLDLSSLDEAEAEARWEALQREQRAAGFDFARAPLMRVVLVRLPRSRTWMLKTEHHMLGDGWSGPVVLGDLQAAYAALRGGSKPALPEPAPYERYIAWLATRDEEAAGAFFADYLAGVEAPTRLPLPPPAAMPAEAAREHASFETSLAAAETEALTAFARRHGLTVNTVVQGALAQVVGHYTGRTDVVLGMLTSGRSAPVAGIERMVGLFINTLPLRARWSDAECVVEWLRRLQAEQAEMRAHEATPLNEVQRWSAVGRGQALFDTLLAFENYPVDESAQQAEVLPIVGFRSFEQTSYPLAIAAYAGETLNLRWMWNPAALRGDDVERLWGHLRALLLDMVAHPDKRLPDLALLTESEQRRLAAWNDTAAPYPEGKCLHDLFDDQAARTPDATAVRFKGEGVTYAELSARSTRLARHLRSLGVGPRVLVGLCVERSVEMIVALLAIVKAGGAYVPLEPSYPAARLSVMIDAARIKVLVTQAEIADRLPPHEAAVVRLDQDAAAWQGKPVTRVESGVTPEDPAYVIYTSGSSGKPKGAMLDHRGPVNTIADINDRFGVGPGDRVLALSAFSFDLSVYDVFGILAAGATMVLPDPTNAKDPAYWAEVVAAEGITIWNTVPALMDALVDHASNAPGADLGTLRLALLSGDWIPVSLPDRLRALVPGIRVISMGGATEASIWSIIYPIEQVDPSWRSIPYGRPMRNQRFHVLDARLEPCPVGVEGMLYIGGIGVAMGYHGEEELTRKAYIIHPRTGERLYRTGDLGRYMADGNIEFLGRKDFQVKIRGFRIELGDIEAALASHPAVKSCVVIAREDTPGDKRLVTYVVSGEGEATANDLRDRIRARLPEYMMPSAFVFLDALPLSSNGKVDRKALPSPEATRDAAETSYVAPRTDAERALAELWSEVLQVSPVGIHDNFFALGGDSILAIQVVGRAKRDGLHLTVRDLFEHQTVAQLSRVVRGEGAVLAEQGAVTGAVPLTPIQRWFLDRDPDDAHHFCTAMLWTPPSTLSPDMAAEALRIIAQQHDALRLRYRREEAGWVQDHAEAATLTLERMDLTAVEPSAREAALESAAEVLQRGMDLARGPVVRAAWLDLGEGGARLLIAMHHLITDVVSWRILCEDVERACEALLAGRTPDLGPKTTSLRQWSERLHALVAGGGLSEELGYWQAQCARGVTPPPGRRSGARGTYGESHEVVVELSAAETSALLVNVASAHGTEIHVALLSALAEALSASSGADTVCVGLEHHGREPVVGDLDASRTVGWFTSLYPVWLSVPPAGDPAALLYAVTEQLRSVPGRGMGYGWLRYAHPDEAVRASLSVQAPVVFNYLGQHETGSSWEIAGTTRSSVSPRFPMLNELTVMGIVVHGRLRLTWGFSRATHDTAAVEAFAAKVLSSLRRLIARCASRGEGAGLTADLA